MKYIELIDKKNASISEISLQLEKEVTEFKKQFNIEHPILIVTETIKVDEQKAYKNEAYAQKVDPNAAGYNRIKTHCFEEDYFGKLRDCSKFGMAFNKLCSFEVLDNEQRSVLSYQLNKTPYRDEIFVMETLSEKIINKYLDKDYDVDIMIMTPDEYLKGVSIVTNRVINQNYYNLSDNNLLIYHGF